MHFHVVAPPTGHCLFKFLFQLGHLTGNDPILLGLILKRMDLLLKLSNLVLNSFSFGFLSNLYSIGLVQICLKLVHKLKSLFHHLLDIVNLGLQPLVLLQKKVSLPFQSLELPP